MGASIFLWPEDSLKDVRAIRDIAINARLGGDVEWTSENISFRKAATVQDYDTLIHYCNRYIRTYDPIIRSKNPVITKTTGDCSRP